MIKEIDVTNYLGEHLLLDFSSMINNDLILSQADGLGPGASTINTIAYASTDGSKFSSARIDQRNIVLYFVYNYYSKKTIEEIRYESYKYFPLKKYVKLRIKTDNREATIEGYVESNEATIFSEATGCQVSIICPDPYFYSVKDVTADLFSVVPLFAFPFDDEISASPSIEFSKYSTVPQATLLYEGDSDIGIVCNIWLEGRVQGITLYDTKKNTSVSINTDTLESILGSNLQRGDKITISTVTGNKNVTLARDGVTYNALHAIDAVNQKWLKLTTGVNSFAITATEGITNLHGTITAKNIYGGM